MVLTLHGYRLLTNNMFEEQGFPNNSHSLSPREPPSAMIYYVSYINISLDCDHNS